MHYHELDPERIKGYIHVSKTDSMFGDRLARLLFYNVTTKAWVISDEYIRTRTNLLRRKTEGFLVSNREWHILHTRKEFSAVREVVGR